MVSATRWRSFNIDPCSVEASGGLKASTMLRQKLFPPPKTNYGRPSFPQASPDH